VSFVRVLGIAILGLTLAGRVSSQEVKYRNVDLPREDRGATGIQFTIPLPDSLAPQRIRAGAELRKLDVAREERGASYLGKTVPGLCDNSRRPFLPPGTPAPTGPCRISITVSYVADSGGTTFIVAGHGSMKIPGSDVMTAESFNPRSSNWSLIRNLARAIAEQK
jgi:hypothetical protein